MKKSVLLFVAVTSAIPAMAIQPKGEKIDTLKAYELQGVQVLSTRANKKTPMAFSNLDKMQIKETNFGKDVPSLLEFLPSITTSSDAGMGIGYTGIHIRGTDPTRINVTANGVPINDSESSQLYWVNMGDFASSVESMQVQRGVGTSTNGAGAFGATVNMQTENIGLKPFAGLDFSGGSYGTHKETFRFGTGVLGEHWGFQGRLSNIGSDGYIDRASSRLNSYFLQGGYFSDNSMVKLITFNGTEKTYMAWDYASKEDMEKHGRTYNPSGMYIDNNGKVDYYHNQTDNYHQQHYQLIWTQRLGNMWNLNTALHYTKGQGYYEQYKRGWDGTGEKLYKYLLEELGKKSDLIRRKQMNNDFYGAIASLNYSDGNRLTANIGGGWNRYDGDHYGNVIWVRQFSGSLMPNHRYYNNNAKKTDGNVYAKVNYEPVPGLNGFVDLQYRHIDYKMSGSSQEFDNNKIQRPLELDRQYDFFNPKFGLSYQIHPSHTVYASYAIAHKEPTRNNFEDMMAETRPTDPMAEKLSDLEIGYKYESGIFHFSANLYYMMYDNQFVLTGAQDTNGEMVARNIKDSYRKGAEQMAGLHPFRGFNWNINATLSRNRAKNMTLRVVDADWNETDVNIGETHLAFSPDFMLNNIFNYHYKGFNASLKTKYVGEQYMTNSNFKSYTSTDGKAISAMIDKYFVSDLDLSYTFRFKGMKSATVGLTVYNIFNEEYETNGSCGMYYKQENGKITAFHDAGAGFVSWATYSAQAPIHAMAHISLNF